MQRKFSAADLQNQVFATGVVTRTAENDWTLELRVTSAATVQSYSYPVSDPAGFWTCIRVSLRGGFADVLTSAVLRALEPVIFDMKAASLLQELVAEGIGLVTVGYSGEGDEGSTTDVRGYEWDGSDTPLDEYAETGEPSGESLLLSDAHERRIRDYVSEALPMGWMDGDGSSGACWIRTETGEVWFDHNDHVVHSEPAPFSRRILLEESEGVDSGSGEITTPF